MTRSDEKVLSSCYLSCLKLAAERGIKSVVFCCISTGEFRFPHERAAVIAVNTVLEFSKSNRDIRVVFNVFKDEDYDIYSRILKP